MIQLKYASLFEIEALHDYYADKRCRDIVITPSPATSRLLSQLGLRLIQSDTGCKIFARVTPSGNTDLVNVPIPDNTRFVFVLQLQNNNFATFTQLSLDKQPGQYYYFNNLTENLGADNAPLLVANQLTKKVSADDLRRFKRNTYQFAYTGAPITNGEVRFTDNGEKFTKELDDPLGNFNFSFNLQEASGGRASFFVGGNKVDDFYLEENGVGQNVFGVIEIFHRAALPNSYRFINNNGSVAAKKYVLSFANRQTTWRYTVNKKFNLAVTDVKIKKNGGGGIDFTKKNGTPAGQFILSSNTAVPLKQEMLTGIRMTDQNDKEIIANLPNPSLGALKQENNQLFSDILITI
jgi:hypothetical protein